MKKHLLAVCLCYFSFCYANAQMEITTEPESTDKIAFYAENSLYGKYTVEINFSRLVNLRSPTGTRNYKGTVGFGRTKLLTLSALIPNRPTDYNFTSFYYEGCARTKPKEDIIHLFPFKNGESRQVGELSVLKVKETDKKLYPDFYGLAFHLKANEKDQAGKLWRDSISLRNMAYIQNL